MIVSIAKKCWLVAAFLIPLACGEPELGPVKTVAFRVIADSLPSGSEVYITGNHSKLENWRPGLVRLKAQPDGAWWRSFTLCFEILRVILKSGLSKDGRDWISGLGFVVAMLAIIYQLLINIGWVGPLWGNYIVYVYGVLALGIAFSIKLSRDFATTHKNLQMQLVQVRELSQKALEQERRAREEEIAHRLLEAEHARTTHELEEARRLQLSMLPKKLPLLADLNIAVHTKTAAEVGGD